MKTGLVALVRLVSALAMMLVAAYYLLASIPFSYYQFLQFPHFWWLIPFIRVHSFVLLAAVMAFLATQRDAPPPLRPWIRYARVATVASAGCMLAITWQPVLLSFDVAAALCFVPLMLLTLVSGIDLAGRSDVFERMTRPPAGTVIVAAATAGALSSAVYFVSAVSHRAAATLSWREVAMSGAVTLASHVGGFAIAAAVAALLAGVVAARRSPRWLEWAAVAGWAAVVLTLLIRRSILSALILTDTRAVGVAAAFAIAITTFASSQLISTQLAARPAPSRRRWWVAAAAAFAVAAMVGIVPRMLTFADWGQTVQKLAVFATWAAVVAVVIRLPVGRVRWLALAGAFVAIFLATVSAAFHVGGLERRPSRDHGPLDMSLAVDRYATFDTSLTVLFDVLRPLVADSDFYAGLRKIGDLSEDASLAAVPMRLVSEFRGAPANPPNIFFIVIDSLRPDYLSAYNPAATFTPAIGAFAAESVVMRHAFSAYAGTALSEPAMWAGGQIPRAIYIKPFSAVNNLDRLLRQGKYRRYISNDEVLNVIFDDWTGTVPLDAELARRESGDAMFKLDLCTTLDELSGRLDRDKNTGPVFFYSQPKNLHVRLLVGEQQYPTFEALHIGNTDFFRPAVSVLGRLDACFGKFIAHLKTSGIYDNSIVVLTSDHGDGYGEGGRWGHAYYLAPETIRIPLIIHVPERLRAGRRIEEESVALSTDVTPTLYDLLGYPVTDRSGLSGRALMPLATEGRERAEDVFLVQSSYSRVFGLLDGGGRWLYTADVNHAREQLYDLSVDSPYPTQLPAADRLQYRKWLLDRLENLGRYYRGGHRDNRCQSEDGNCQ